MKNKKGISAVLETVIMVALTISAIAVIWVVVNGLVEKNINETESCFGIFNKVTINPLYTCYNSTEKQLQFSVNVKDIDVEDILVAISSEGSSINFNLNESDPNLLYLDETPALGMPNKNSGITYRYQLPVSFIPRGIEIAPLINGKLCGATSSVEEIDNCASLG